MPEPYWPKRKGAYSLSHAREHYEVARIWCRYCQTERHFLLEDLKQLFGDVECDDVIFQPGWRCVQCKKEGTLEFELVHPSAQDRQKLLLRRIKHIWYVRKVEWWDEQP